MSARVPRAPALPPRYFTSARTEHGDPLAPFEHVVDALRLEPDEGAPCDVLVAIDAHGHLRTALADDLGALPDAIANALRFHEVQVGALRRIRARTLHILDVQYVELAPDVPGVNDPVHVHGKLFELGPLRGVERVPWRRGALTVTHADVLDAFVRGAPHAMTGAGAEPRARRAAATRAGLRHRR